MKLGSAALQAVWLSLLLAGCAAFGGGEARRWLGERLPASGFRTLQSAAGDGRPLLLLRGAAEGGRLSVYIEGDGAAWPSRYHPPYDPTPDKTTVLAMALADPGAAVAYLGRSCHYLDEAALEQCPSDWWTRARFAAAALARLDAALDAAKTASGAQTLRLIGYSGGGVLATLLAAKRRDVVALVTVAAPLRVGAWVRHHGLTPLQGDDPDTIALATIPAVHFVGADDRIVPPEIVAPLAARSGARLRVIEDFGHSCCWAQRWPELLGELP